MQHQREHLTALAKLLSELDLPPGTVLTLPLPHGDLTISAEQRPYVRLENVTEEGVSRHYTVTLSQASPPAQAGAHVDPEPDHA